METPKENERYPISQRLASLDALRGFDMMFIMGGDSIGHALEHWKAAESGPLHTLATQLNHVAWEGFRFYDLIFPLFVFIAGISLVFSLAKVQATSGRAAAAKRVIVRGLLLYVIGIFYYGGWGNDIDGRQGVEGIRLFGVLQRIAIAYLGCLCWNVSAGFTNHWAAESALVSWSWSVGHRAWAPLGHAVSRDQEAVDEQLCLGGCGVECRAHGGLLLGDRCQRAFSMGPAIHLDWVESHHDIPVREHHEL